MATPAIAVSNLVKKYKGRGAILDGVTFVVESGEFVAVTGTSGCGKTTLLNMMGGLDRPTSGDVVVDGVSLNDLTEDELGRLRLDKIGFVFQDYNLLPKKYRYTSYAGNLVKLTSLGCSKFKFFHA